MLLKRRLTTTVATHLLPSSLYSRNEREAIVRHYLADEPIDQVAREMGVPLGTVKSWLSRGRSRLAECLGVKEAEGLTTK